jgi:hypothetical protein
MTKEKKQSRFRFSLRVLIASVTILAVGLGGWIAYSKHRMQNLIELRQQGAIVIVRDRTPQALQAVGISELSPFFDVPTVELYVTPVGNDAFIGNSDTLMSSDIAQKTIIEQASIARSYGAEDLQLILIDSFDPKWMTFGEDNSLSVIGDSKQRYMKRLEANQKSGANINP